MVTRSVALRVKPEYLEFALSEIRDAVERGLQVTYIVEWEEPNGTATP